MCVSQRYRTPWCQILLLPHVSHTFAKPARRDHFLLRVELYRLAALDVEVAVERVVPTGEGEHRHRRGDADVDSHHSGLHAMLELACGLSAVGEDRRTVSKGRRVRDAD